MAALLDQYGREHNYLRISLTDACNFRCFYCMPNEEVCVTPKAHLMQVDEIIQISKQFVTLGVNKIRLTGGEPMVRKDFGEILSQLSQLPVELTLTTNATLIDTYLQDLLAANVRSLNVSLDTLDAAKFILLTKRDKFKKVWDNIMLLLKHNFSIKLNVVLIRGINDQEIKDFISLTKQYPLHIRFIEFMPFTANKWDDSRLVSFEEILSIAHTHFDIIKLKDHINDTARKFKVIGNEGTFAVISTMTNPFCDGCNRIRLTADGKIKNCLFSSTEFDILSPLRHGEGITNIIHQALIAKKKALGGQLFEDFKTKDSESLVNRSMISIGG